MLCRNHSGLGTWGRDVPHFGTLWREMDRFVSDLERGYASSEQRATSFRVSNGITVDDTESEYRVRAEVPGFSQEELVITVEQDTLTLKGEPRAEDGGSTEAQARYTPRAFIRRFSLPARVDADKATASLRNGVLTLTLPKAAEDRPRQIAVNAEA